MCLVEGSVQCQLPQLMSPTWTSVTPAHQWTWL